MTRSLQLTIDQLVGPVPETKLLYSFAGINKKLHPKWGGWRIITESKRNGIDPVDICCSVLAALVVNFHLVKALEELSRS